VVEKYSLREHTAMVLRQFEKYFGKKTLPGGVDKDFFRLILVLHDIGKTRAVKEGNKDLQHKYTPKMVKDILSELEYSEKQINLAINLLSDDPLGELFKKKNINKCVEEINKLSKRASMDPEEFFELISIFFKSDASSYTLEAGGKMKNLDHLFEVDRANGDLDFSEEAFDLADQVEEKLFLQKQIAA